MPLNDNTTSLRQKKGSPFNSVSNGCSLDEINTPFEMDRIDIEDETSRRASFAAMRSDGPACSNIIRIALAAVLLSSLCILFYFIHDRQGNGIDNGPSAIAGFLQQTPEAASLKTAVPNDLHGIHDLLLVGYAGIFVRHREFTHASAKSEAGMIIATAVTRLAKSLLTLHPFHACRTALANAKSGVGNDSKALVVEYASVAWSCLPAHFSSVSFLSDSAFTEAALDDDDLQMDAKNPSLLPAVKAQLGVCKNSLWDRTCSYWSSLHILAARAEAAGPQIASAFLRDTLLAIFGGATMCKGCMRHFRILHAPIIPEAVLQGTLTDTELEGEF
eukprot:TRINITY_DN12110_c0_g2_i1.p1 TRINITY_DN12110_c0_g2~~TRINITY_DN12110_c0_g2_i1.p1  ORF type:complete len:331 (+),score=51.69 TRINITY_DN12110_c0_g2_i1:106-1098(+)